MSTEPNKHRKPLYFRTEEPCVYIYWLSPNGSGMSKVPNKPSKAPNTLKRALFPPKKGPYVYMYWL